MFRCEWSDPVLVRELIEGVSDLVDTASFHVDGEKIRMEASDPSIICKIEIEADKRSFSIYEIDSEIDFYLDINLMKKICRRLRSGDKISINVENNYLEFTIHNFVERYFRIPLLEFGDPLPQINMETSTFLRIKAEVFIDLIKDIAVIGSSLIIKATKDEIIFFSEEEGVRSSITISKDNGAIEEFRVDKECISKFNLSYILSFLKTVSSAEFIEISFGNKDTPLKLECSNETGMIRFYLAPMEI